MKNMYIIKSPALGEITEKKSRFIGQIFPAWSEEEALLCLSHVKKEHHSARHNCHAFSISIENEITRFSDDGEPSGTAGKPILEVLAGSCIKNAIIVVTRYFGGVLLGTGGLVKAYTQAAKEAVAAAKTFPVRSGFVIDFTCEYNFCSIIENAASAGDVFPLKKDYAEKVSYSLCVPSLYKNEFVKNLTNSSNGQIKPSEKESYFYLDGNAPVIC